MFLGLFGQRSAKIAQLQAQLEAQQTLIQSQGQLIGLQVEKINTQLEELKALKENIATLHEKAFEQTLSKLNGSATADLVAEVRSAIVNDPSFATDVANDMIESVAETVGENLDHEDLVRNIKVSHEDIADNLVGNLDLDDLAERLYRQIDFDDIASRVSINYSELASEVEMYSLAQEIDVSNIEIDYDEIRIDYDEIRIDHDEISIDHDEINIDIEALVENLDYQAVSARLDLKEIASQINPNALIDAIDLQELMSTYHLLPQAILDHTVTSKDEANGEWTDLEWSILMTVRKAVEELANEFGESEADES